VVSENVVAWTTYDDAGRGREIFVYTRSKLFRCAHGSSHDASACLLVLASVLVHESWHFEHGPSEDAAYGRQFVFLKMNRAPEKQVAEVLKARREAVKRQKEEIRAARKMAHEESTNASRRDEQVRSGTK
jgi:hypothetical protein